MIRLRQVKVEIEKNGQQELKEKVMKKLKVKKIKEIYIIKKSLDARKKENLLFSYIVDVVVDHEEKVLKRIKSKDIFIAPKEEYLLSVTGKKTLDYRPIIVGSGPSGLICAYLLSEIGFKPLIIERGSKIEERVKKVEEFWENNTLDLSTNVQFGEGGAGTFSDGKLTTLIKDTKYRQKKVLEIFIENGANKEILYENKPHIGTDQLREIIKNMRKKIISKKGKFLFNTTLTDLEIKNGQIVAIEVNHKEKIKTNILILAIGHSARDTYKMLSNKNLAMESKPFAVGVRIQHPQKLINKSQYGKEKINGLKEASYKLTYKTKKGRAVYTFCMCPGGYVINSSSEKDQLVINGMSNYKRESKNANSAIVVAVSKKDYGPNLFDGIKFQQELEKRAYLEGKGDIPTQRYKDLKEGKKSKHLGRVSPIFKGKYQLANLREILPSEIIDSIIESIEYFNTKIEGYSNPDSIISAVESRTSSPIKMIRDENMESNIKGIYPIGEGSGSAGGITSSAIDGVKVVEKIVKIYRN